MKRLLALCLLMAACSGGEDGDPEGTGGQIAEPAGGAAPDGGTPGSGGEARGSGGQVAENPSGGEPSGGATGSGGAFDGPRCDWIEVCANLNGGCRLTGEFDCAKTGTTYQQYNCGLATEDGLGEESGYEVTDGPVFPCEVWGADEGGYLCLDAYYEVVDYCAN